MSATHVELGPEALREKKKVKIFRAFLVAAIINNTLLAIYTLAFAGGAMFAKVAAPAWSAVAIGGAGVATVFGCLAGLAWKRTGVYIVTVAGLAATGVAASVKLFMMAGAFAFGTAVLLLLVRHVWSRLS